MPFGGGTARRNRCAITVTKVVEFPGLVRCDAALHSVRVDEQFDRADVPTKIAGVSKAEIARRLAIGRTSVRRILIMGKAS